MNFSYTRSAPQNKCKPVDILASASEDADAPRVALAAPGSAMNPSYKDWVPDDPGLAQMANPSFFFTKEKGPMLKEFKEFALKGNVLDMAVGIIIGAAFGRIAGSVVEDILMPPLGLLLGKVDFSNLFVSLTGQHYDTLAAAKAAGAATINYGLFVNHIINFVIVAFAVFILVKNVNRLKREQAAAPAVPATKECPRCCTLIALKATRCPACTSEVKVA